MNWMRLSVYVNGIKKASRQLEKLNSDCNKTAGLEAKLSLAVGARVMLRRNLDTKPVNALMVLWVLLCV